jgi:uncharacterized protein
VCAGAAAGVVGTAGGISSLVSYPALLAVGISPLPANVTNLVALVASGVGSTLGSRPELEDQTARLRRWALPCAAGGTAGAILLLATPTGVFNWIVPFLVASASLVLVAQPRITTWHKARPRRGTEAIMLAGVIGISAYSGYFGAGAGILLLAVLLVLVDQDLPRANALKNTLAMITNLIPAILFAASGHVVWVAAISLAVGAFAGGAAGPAVTRRVAQRPLRLVICVCGLALAGWLLARAAG